ncbi:nucleotidyltransferase [Microcoleus sp. F8_C2]
MVNLQTQFKKFHNTIKVDFDDNQPLRDKRNLIIDNLKDGLEKQFFRNKAPTFNSFNQGSYGLATGVEPLPKEDYDIDVGIIFNLSKNLYQPVEVKKWVYTALNTGARTVEIKKPCVRVQYHLNNEKSFHVDLAIYSLGKKDDGGNKTTHIAKGLIKSPEDEKIWELSEPYKLKELLESEFADSLDREQFRRIIRYLKRWKDYNFCSTGTERPTGIAITACCYEVFTPEKDNDLRSLLNVVSGIIGMFSGNNQISVKLPVQPYNDLFKKMTNIQMTSMKTKLINLQNTLTAASQEPYTFNACASLRKVFGSDFPGL